MSQLVAYNMAFFRKAADLGQQEFGQLVGWSAASVSAAERSWDGKRIKKFDADEITQVAAVLGLPVTALFLLPEDHGTAVRYVIDMLGQPPGRFSEVFPLQVFPSPSQCAVAGRPVLAAYRDRVTSLTYSEPAPSDEQWQAKAGAALEELAVHMAEARLARLAGDACSPEHDANEERVQTAGSLSPASEELDSLLRAREQVEGQIEQVEGRLAYLRTFERNYRTKLQAFAEWQLRELYAPEMRQQAEERIRELHERTAAAGAAGASALVLHQDGTYEVLPLGPGN